MPTKFSDVKAGDMIIANGTHRCLHAGEVCTVYADDEVQKLMHVACACPTRHYLTEDGDGYLIGFQKMRHQPDDVHLRKRPAAFRYKNEADQWVYTENEAETQRALDSGRDAQGLYVRDGA
jgi:hypothetical protein